MLLLVAGLLLAAADTSPPTIEHKPVLKAERDHELVIEAKIKDPSGVFGVKLFWRPLGNEEFAATDLTLGGKDVYSSAIPAMKMSASVEYYIEAFDKKGNGPAQVGSREAPIQVQVAKPAVVAQAPEPEPAPAPRPAPEPPSIAASIPPAESASVLQESNRTKPMITIGAGAVLAAIGAGLWFTSTSTISDLDAKYPGNGAGRVTADLDATRSARSTSQLGSILMISGAVVGAGGLAWYFLPSNDGGGAGVAGTF